jgi:membrane fusion protein (multidrug efflux system)
VSGPQRLTQRVPPLVRNIVLGTLLLSVALFGLVWRERRRDNKLSLAAVPRPVSGVYAIKAEYRQSLHYVGTLEPWQSANIGPQFVSAYVSSVLVRPGASVRAGHVLATLDCRNVTAASKEVQARARATDARQQALAHQSQRMHGLREHGFVSQDDDEQKAAQTLAEQEQLIAERSRIASVGLEVDDCVLRAPFAGDVVFRAVDPGAFVRPGTSMLTLVDRGTVRFTADVPESDYQEVAPAKKVRIQVDSLSRSFDAVIARRTPGADLETRTVHFEADLDNPRGEIPINTTGEAFIDVGEPVPAAQLPLRAATIRNGKATLFTVQDGKARLRVVGLLGERDGQLFLEATLEAGALTVVEGRTQLQDGDAVEVKEEAVGPPPTAAQEAHAPATAIQGTKL